MLKPISPIPQSKTGRVLCIPLIGVMIFYYITLLTKDPAGISPASLIGLLLNILSFLIALWIIILGCRASLTLIKKLKLK